MLIFDIETGPAEAALNLMPQFVDDVGDFDPSSVKVGNLKDAAKIKEKVDVARAAHAALVAAAPERKAQREREFLERAALSPMTGQVLAVGYMQDGKADLYCQLGDVGEHQLLGDFWRVFCKASGPMVGHNIFGFDLPFLVRRSYLLDVDVPASVRKGRYWSPVFVDTMDVWACGARDYIKLDDLAKCCGLPGKMDGVNGADFARLLSEEPEKAKEYLRCDLQATWDVAVKLQIG